MLLGWGKFVAVGSARVGVLLGLGVTFGEAVVLVGCGV